MDIVEFFQLSSGKWFSQRTSHRFSVDQQESGKSNIQLDVLDKHDPAVIQLCQHYQIDPELALFGARVTWDGTLEPDESKKHCGSTLLVPIADGDNQREGKLLRDAGYAEQSPIVGRYIMGDNDELTLITEHETMYSKERFWFESPNVRFRHSILQQAGGFSVASFCSEIRMGVAQPPAANSSGA